MKDDEVNMVKVVGAAMAAGNAYLACAWLDSKLSGYEFNDLKLVGQVFTTKRPLWLVQGLVGHFGFSVVVSLVYASWTRKWLPGPGWLKGLLFLQLENAVLYPLATLLNSRHAGVRSGQVPSLTNLKTIKGQVTRHAAFGLALGLLYNEGTSNAQG